MLAARLNSVDLNAGGGTLLIDAIAAAVIGGCSLFGGRGEVRDALFGSLVIATIANGLNTLNLTQGVIYIITGCILLFAVTLDTVAPVAAEEGRPVIERTTVGGCLPALRETPHGRLP